MTANPRRAVTLVLLAATLALAVTGVWLWLGAPPGGGRRGGGFAATGVYPLRHTLRDIHLYAAAAFGVATILHLRCNWVAFKRHLGLGGPPPEPCDAQARNPSPPDTLPRR